MIKLGWTELGLEDISYGQGDIRIHLTPELIGDKLHFSIGINTDNILYTGFKLWF